MYVIIILAIILYFIGKEIEDENISENKTLTVKTSNTEIQSSGFSISDSIIEQGEDIVSKIIEGAKSIIKPVQKFLSKANRNNNPGNLRYAGQTNATQSSDNFAIFKTLQDGWTALYKQIDLDKSRNHSLYSFIHKYAPTSENVTANYLKFLMQGTGKDAVTPLKEIDTVTLAKLIAKYEGFV